MPGAINFGTSADGSEGLTHRMIIDSSGNVGIGETNPDELLHIKSSTDAKPVIKLENSGNNSNSPQIQFLNSSTANDNDITGDHCHFTWYRWGDIGPADPTPPPVGKVWVADELSLEVPSAQHGYVSIYLAVNRTSGKRFVTGLLFETAAAIDKAENELRAFVRPRSAALLHARRRCTASHRSKKKSQLQSQNSRSWRSRTSKASSDMDPGWSNCVCITSTGRHPRFLGYLIFQ